jgi:putative transposase
MRVPWELRKVEDKRKELVRAYIEGAKMTNLCRQHNVSRKTAYKWYNRYRETGLEESLKNRSRAPRNPVCVFSEEQIQMAIDLKLKYPTWGPKKVLARLAMDHLDMKWPSPTWLYEIFKEHHLVISRRLRRRVPATHPLGEVNQSNDVWMADFKGWFLTRNNEKCEPLTISDGYSRFLIHCEHREKKTADQVWPAFEQAFKEYGLPKRVRTDNGPPFGCMGAGRITRLSVNLIKAGVTPEWIHPGHPEENGRHERLHLTLKKETATPPGKNLVEQRLRLRRFQKEYNYERPHEALEQKPPASYYQVPQKRWDGILRKPEYNRQVMEVRKVCPSGCLWLNQEEFFISNAMIGEYIGLKEAEDGSVEAYYGPVYLGKLKKKGLERPKMKPRKMIRRT